MMYFAPFILFLAAGSQADLDCTRGKLGDFSCAESNHEIPTESLIQSPSPDSIRSLDVISVEPTVTHNVFTKRFHDYAVVKSHELTDSSVIKEIMGWVNADLVPYHANKCLFQPHHGLRVHYKEKVVDYLICYRCGDVQKFDGDKLKRFSLRPAIPGHSAKEMLDGILSQN